MARTLATMRANVGRKIGDTSTTTGTYIDTFLNNSYFDIVNRLDWNAQINNDYTFPSVSGASEVALEDDFDSEIAVIDTTNGVPLTRMTEQEFLQLNADDYSSGSLSTGNPERYFISRDDAIITLHPTPTSVITYLMPYKTRITELATDSSTVAINDIEWIMELGATAEALEYKRQYQKAAYMQQRYEESLRLRMHSEANQLNQIHVMTPYVYPDRWEY